MLFEGARIVIRSWNREEPAIDPRMKEKKHKKENKLQSSNIPSWMREFRPWLLYSVIDHLGDIKPVYCALKMLFFTALVYSSFNLDLMLLKRYCVQDCAPPRLSAGQGWWWIIWPRRWFVKFGGREIKLFSGKRCQTNGRKPPAMTNSSGKVMTAERLAPAWKWCLHHKEDKESFVGRYLDLMFTCLGSISKLLTGFLLPAGQWASYPDWDEAGGRGFRGHQSHLCLLFSQRRFSSPCTSQTVPESFQELVPLTIHHRLSYDNFSLVQSAPEQRHQTAQSKKTGANTVEKSGNEVRFLSCAGAAGAQRGWRRRTEESSSLFHIYDKYHNYC